MRPPSYQPTTSTLDPNHAIAIVGWDDDKAVAGAPGSGAWLCKNSWGETFGFGGYFWISYWDKHAGKHPEMGAIAFRDVGPPDWDTTYSHDYHGWRDTYTDAGRAFSAFTAHGDEVLEAVGIITTEDETSFTVRVWDRFEAGVLLDELSSYSGDFSHTGLHTVDLPIPVSLAEGDDFFVELEVFSGGLAYDRTSDVPVLLGASTRALVESVAAPGESYVRPGSEWVEINSAADALEAGAHISHILFTNATSHLGDTSRMIVVAVGDPEIRHSETLDADPGWATEGQWSWGQPTGQGGDHGSPDPTAGFTGAAVYGYNLGGDYANNLPETHLTSTAFDCRGLYGIHLNFQRWLGVEQPIYDHASVRVSSDGMNWTTVWENDVEVADSTWVPVDLDISSVADNAETLYLRWTMGATDSGWTYCGWNIDD
ncbi:MAG: hypothetical protein KAJ78_06950, partial [Acidobacteria bacterium]|nr:hypothetical protein [Acidobacteriota bacterium]